MLEDLCKPFEDIVKCFHPSEEIPIGITEDGKHYIVLSNIDNDEATSKNKCDMVKHPNHYQILPEYEVKDVNKALLDKIEESDFKMSFYEAGWYQQAMQYFMRFYAKNGIEDLEKGIETMQFVVDSLKSK